MGMVRETEAKMAQADDAEALDDVHGTRALPKRGMQVRFEYTVHAHFRLLKRFFAGVGKVRFFIDQDETLRSGAISAFADEVRVGSADILFVKVNKALTVDQRKRMVSDTATKVLEARRRMPDGGTDEEVLQYMIVEALQDLDPDLPWRKRWVRFPMSTMYEADKAVCLATDRGDYSHEHLAAIMARASLHGIDRFFMQLRRLLSPLERPIGMPSNQGRSWYGYAPYNPAMIQKLIDIYRVFYNYAKVGRPKDTEGRRRPGRTPAMAIGLAKGVVRIDEILYFGR